MLDRSTTKLRRTVVSIACLVALAVPRAEANDVHDDTGAWAMLAAQGTFAVVDSSLGKLRWWFDLQPRFTEDSGYEQLLVRPGLGYDLGGGASLWLGYAWIETDPEGGDDFEEHRIWQQFLWAGRTGALAVQSRTRLEQRFVETGSETGWRLRQFVKLTPPLAVGSCASLAAYEEAFFDLNDTDWGATEGFTQNRLFVGLAWKLDDAGRATLETGYLNQYLARERRRDTMNHLLSVNLLLNFP
jgi:hypothetical protein